MPTEYGNDVATAAAVPQKHTTMASNKLARIQAVVENMNLQQNEDDLMVMQEAALAEDLRWAPNAVWREKVVQWSYDVVDHLNEERSVVYVAINILDRYCAIQEQSMDEKSYEIASLSSIFLAVRISGSGNLLISELVSMSRGGITTKDIISTGTDIVRELQWEYKIITPMDFVKSFLKLVAPAHFRILDQASYLTELAVCDVVLAHSKASFLAIAACLSVLRSGLPSAVPGFVDAVLQTTEIDANSDEVQDLCARLAVVYASSGGNDSQVMNVHNERESEKNLGPHIIEDDDDDQEDTTNGPSVSHAIFGMGTKRRSFASLDALCPEMTQEDKRIKLGI